MIENFRSEGLVKTLIEARKATLLYPSSHLIDSERSGARIQIASPYCFQVTIGTIHKIRDTTVDSMRIGIQKKGGRERNTKPIKIIGLLGIFDSRYIDMPEDTEIIQKNKLTDEIVHMQNRVLIESYIESGPSMSFLSVDPKYASGDQIRENYLIACNHLEGNEIDPDYVFTIDRSGIPIEEAINHPLN